MQWVEFIRAHAEGNGAKAAKGAKRIAPADSSIYSEESNYTTWRLAKMNLAFRLVLPESRSGRWRTRTAAWQRSAA